MALLVICLASAVATSSATERFTSDLETLTISITRVGLSGKLLSIGLDPAGSLTPPIDPAVAGHYEAGPLPNEVGNTVIVGTVDSQGTTGVFWELRQVVIDDLIVIRSKSDFVHSISTFSVTEVTLYRKSDFPTDRLYANLTYPGVALITDGGPNADNTAYLGNLVVYARLKSEVLLY